MGTLVFVRHGQASLFAANYDELSARGRAQARALGQALGRRGVRPDRVLAGPATRQRDTAAIVAEAAREHGVDWPDAIILPELDEHDAFGMIAALAGDPAVAGEQAALAELRDPARKSAGFQRMFEAIMARWLRGEVDSGPAETWPMFRDRVERGLGRIVADVDGRGARVFAFSSVGPLAVLLRRALGTDDLAGFRTAWRCRNAAMTTFLWRPSAASLHELTLDAFNDVSFLLDPSEHTFR